MNSPEITFQPRQRQEPATKADYRQLNDEMGLPGIIERQPTHALVATTEGMESITVHGQETDLTPTVGRASRINTTGVSMGLAGAKSLNPSTRCGKLTFGAFAP